MSLHPSRILRTTAFAGAALLVASVGAVSPAAPANATTNKNGVCETVELCLYYGKDYGSPVFDLHFSDYDFGDDSFPDDDEKVDNNTRSYRSKEIEGADPTWYWYVYDEKNFRGEPQCIEPGEKGNFDSDLWEKASSAEVVFGEPCDNDG
jgi:hypothetical protein